MFSITKFAWCLIPILIALVARRILSRHSIFAVGLSCLTFWFAEFVTHAAIWALGLEPQDSNIHAGETA